MVVWTQSWRALERESGRKEREPGRGRTRLQFTLSQSMTGKGKSEWKTWKEIGMKNQSLRIGRKWPE